MKFFCKNCKYSFFADGKRACPRCNSHNLYQTEDDRKDKDEVKTEEEPKKKYSFGSAKYVEGDSKSTWKDFHKRESRECPDCGGAEFDMDWKHKEKTCRKCGAILPLARRMS